MRKNKTDFLVVFIFFFLSSLHSQTIQNIYIERLPQIHKLSTTDILFKQFSQTVDYNEKQISMDKHENLEIEFYSYVPEKYDDLLSIHAATGIPYDTIATLNSISDQNAKLYGKKIILPTAKGVFVTDNPKTNFEVLINQENAEIVGETDFPCYNVNGRFFYFLTGGRFSSTQRAFFLDSGMQLPLDNILITSKFGFRNSPVYGKWKFHNGIDLAAAEGSPVYACKSGKISVILENDIVFGNCIIIFHDGGLASVYAHLSRKNVKKNEFVKKGQIIGLTGQTGLATGPHLHFEIRMNGNATDPEAALRIPQKQ